MNETPPYVVLGEGGAQCVASVARCTLADVRRLTSITPEFYATAACADDDAHALRYAGIVEWSVAIKPVLHGASATMSDDERARALFPRHTVYYARMRDAYRQVRRKHARATVIDEAFRRIVEEERTFDALAHVCEPFAVLLRGVRQLTHALATAKVPCVVYYTGAASVAVFIKHRTLLVSRDYDATVAVDDFMASRDFDTHALSAAHALIERRPPRRAHRNVVEPHPATRLYAAALGGGGDVCARVREADAWLVRAVCGAWCQVFAWAACIITPRGSAAK